MTCECDGSGMRYSMVIAETGVPVVTTKVCTGPQGHGCVESKDARKFHRDVDLMNSHIATMSPGQKSGDGGTILLERHRSKLARLDTHTSQDSILVTANEEVAMRMQLRWVRKWAEKSGVPLPAMLPATVYEECERAGWGRNLKEPAFRRVLGLDPPLIDESEADPTQASTSLFD